MQRELSSLALRPRKPRRIGDSQCHVSIHGGLEREMDQAGPWEEASGLREARQGIVRNLHFHKNKGQTVFQDQVNKKVKKSKA